MKMGSRRSSDSGSAPDVDISLEYDDYPLDLVSSVATHNLTLSNAGGYLDVDVLPNNMLSNDTDAGSVNEDCETNFIPHESHLSCNIDTKIWKLQESFLLRTGERDRLITDEVITDFGRRSDCDYDKDDVDRDEDGESNDINNDQLMQCTSNEGDHKTSSTSTEAELSKFKCFASKCQALMRIFLAEHNPLPEKPSLKDRVLHAVLCPPHGRVSQSLTHALLVILLWVFLWLLMQDKATFGGDIFSLFMLYTGAYIGGRLVMLIHVPSHVGMMLAGVALGNIRLWQQDSSINLKLKAIIRLCFVGLYLLLVGLRMNFSFFKKLSCTKVRLSSLPSIAEIVTVACVSYHVIGVPLNWSMLVGGIISGLSPTNVIPIMQRLRQKARRASRDLSDLLTQASIMEECFSLLLCSLFLGATFNSSSDLTTIMLCVPLETVGGIFAGLLTGFIFTYIPHQNNKNVILSRVTALLFGAFSLSMVSFHVRLCGAAVSSCLTTAAVCGNFWRYNDRRRITDIVNGLLAHVWSVFEPICFGLIGHEFRISDWETAGLILSVIVSVTLVRMLTSFMVVLGQGFPKKTKLFISFLWLSKGPSQAILACIPIDGSTLTEDPSHLGHFEMMATCVVAAICLHSSLSSLIASWLGERHLEENDDFLGTPINLSIYDQVCEQHATINTDKQLMQMKKMLKRKELLYERETVT